MANMQTALSALYQRIWRGAEFPDACSAVATKFGVDYDELRDAYDDECADAAEEERSHDYDTSTVRSCDTGTGEGCFHGGDALSPRLEREAGMDDMADHAQRFAPIRCPLPDARMPVRELSPLVATRLAEEPSPLLLSTPTLLAEVDALCMRVVRCETRARDVLLVQTLAARLTTASAAHARATNREPLEGMLLVEIADERTARAPALSFDRFRRGA